MAKTQSSSFTILAEPTVLIQPRKHLFDLDLAGIWAYRELLYFLIWRDLKVRYKQTLLGAGWVIIQPLMTMVIFTVIFGNFAKIPSDGLPYPIFSYAALLPWNLFSSSLSRGGESVVGNANLVTKIYFPRLVLPLVRSSFAGGGLRDSICDFDWNDDLVRDSADGRHPDAADFRPASPLHCARGGALACSVERKIQRCPLYDSVSGPNLDVRLACRLSRQLGAGEMALVIQPTNPMAGVIEGFRWALFRKPKS